MSSLIDGVKMIKKVDSAVKSVTGSSKNKEDKSKKKKGRPTCKRDEEEEKRSIHQKLLTNPNLKFIGM